MIQPKDFDIEIGQSSHGTFVRVTHKPTGEQRLVDPVDDAAVGLTRDRLIRELCSTLYRDEDIRIHIGRSTGGDFIEVIHLPSGVRRSAMRREVKNEQDLLDDVLDELYKRKPTD